MSSFSDAYPFRMFSTILAIKTLLTVTRKSPVVVAVVANQLLEFFSHEILLLPDPFFFSSTILDLKLD